MAQTVIQNIEGETKVPHINDLHRPASTVQQWLSQAEEAETGKQEEGAAPVRVTGVRLNSVEGELRVVLETDAGKALQGTADVNGNTLIVLIPNAQLADGKEFRQDNPIAGIASISVERSNSNSIQIRIVGIDDVPDGRIVQSQSGLILSVSAVEPEEEVIVTAQKRPENPQDIPISITAIPRQAIEDAQIDSFSDVAANTPNFFALPQGSGNFLNYSIRGLGNSNFAARDAVGFYIDDVPYDYTSFIDVPLFDLERVEVLRGPQSTLYGRNSQAGVVNIISRSPSNDPEVRALVGYGSSNNRNLQLSLSDAVIPDRLFFRLAGAYIARDGFTENTFTNENVGEKSSLSGRAQILWTPDQEWSVSFNANASYSDHGSTILVPLNQSDPFKIDYDFNGFDQVSTNTQALKIAYDGPKFRATAITTRRFTFQDNPIDSDFTSLDLIRRKAQFDSTLWSQELRIQSPEDANQLRWLFGGYFESRAFRVLGSGLQFSDLGAAAFGLPFAGFDRADADTNQATYAAFSQVDYTPIQPLTLTAGLRYESTTSRITRQRNLEVAGTSLKVPTGLSVSDVETSDRVWLPRFAAQYRFNPNVSAYGSITRGYKPGGFNSQAESLNLLTFASETSWNYELGFKSSWLDDRLTVNLAAFSNHLDNYQVLLPDNTGAFSNVANAEARIRGVELEIKATPVRGLDVIAGFGYADAKFTDYTNPFTGQNFNGNRLTLAPNFTYNLALQYRSVRGIFARLDLQGVGKYFFDDGNQLKQHPFALVNARIGYENSNWGIYLFAMNLLNTEYVTSAYFFPPPQAVGTYGDRRMFGIQVKAAF
ncbi:TonB-dependent receptor domain-containing protein [Myxacorys almedinensis]|uniref:TonB-dependent receptor domain-containing protein n=1 Tax=Myxacorys almedinensis TaxID=2651157 RepID=UPI001EE49F6F|nr:TonB-dependent receptor [Myxacorys almedinensis]